jgi:hypothetical protein
MANVTVNNLVLGPGTLYHGLVGAVEPLDTAVNEAPAASAWNDCGGTQGGISLTITNTYTELTVDQIVDAVGRRISKREVGIDVNMAEPTLENLTLALNGGTNTTGTGFKTWAPNFSNSASQPTYCALILDGYAPQLTDGSRATRRAIVRKGLSTDAIKLDYKENGQTVIAAKFMAHYISNAISPIYIVDEIEGA